MPPHPVNALHPLLPTPCTHSPPCPAGSAAPSSCSPCGTSPSLSCAQALQLPHYPEMWGRFHSCMKHSERVWCPPFFALVSPQLFSFLSSLPCSSFLPFDVWPLLCSRLQTAYQVEMTAPTSQLGAIRRFCFSRTLALEWLRADSCCGLMTGGTWSRLCSVQASGAGDAGGGMTGRSWGGH